MPEFLNAFYVVGSVALDEFNLQFSDIDFVAVLRRPAKEQEIETLRSIHQEVERLYPHWKLSGMYLLGDEIGKYTEDIHNLIGFHDGALRVQKNFELNPVTWWILKHHGIPLLGPDPGALPIGVNPRVLVAWTQRNMNTYWKSWTRRPIRLAALLTHWGIQWTVLGVARQFYTIREQAIISKQRAGEYALMHVPSQWHPIVQEALRIRSGGTDRLYRSRLVRMVDAIRFMKFIMKASDENVEKTHLQYP